MTALGLHALQHRGQEAAGITSHDGKAFIRTARWATSPATSIATTHSRASRQAAIGHVRYSTTGETALRNAQPLFAELSIGGFAVAHNGNLSNATTLRRELSRRGSIFQSTTRHRDDRPPPRDARATAPLLDRIIDALQQVEGAYSLSA